MKPIHARWANGARAVVVTLFALFSCCAWADFAKSIQVQPNVQVNAITTWYYLNCTTSGGVGSYTTNVAPKHGTLAFATVSGPVPGCPAGSPSLPASAAYYTWTDPSLAASTDYFQLFYVLNGSVAEVIDVSVSLRPCAVDWNTVNHVPGIADTRQKLGVGEAVHLYSATPLTWNVASGNGTISPAVSGTTCSGSGGSGPIVASDVCFSAPNATDHSVVDAAASDASVCSVAFDTVPPASLIFQRLVTPVGAPDYLFNGTGGLGLGWTIGMSSVVFVQPGDVSFANIRFSEHDIPKPYVVPTLNTLYNVFPGVNAWLIGCDYDKEVGQTFFPQSRTSDWVWVDGTGHETAFSKVETRTSFNPFKNPKTGTARLSKGQTFALGADGQFVSSPGPIALLAVPAIDHDDLNPPKNKDRCLNAVSAQFTLIQ